MEVLLILIPVSVLLGSVFLGLFILAQKKDQFEDGESPALSVFWDDQVIKKHKKSNDVIENKEEN